MKPRCPTCKKELPQEQATPAQSKTFPFCGTRCKAADLGSWLNGGYVVASPMFDEDAIQQEDSDAELLN